MKKICVGFALVAALVVAACSEKSSLTDSVASSPVPGVGILSTHTNEPSGMTALTDYPFTNLPPLSPADDGGWTRFGSANAIVTSEATAGIDSAPESPGSVLQGSWPGNLGGGTGPFNIQYPISGNRQRLYIDFYMWLDTGFSNDGNTGTKFAFLAHSGGYGHYLNLTGGAGLTGSLGINLSGNGLNRNMPASYSFADNRGKWIRVEVLLTANTSGNADGLAELWVDGVKKLDENDVQYFLTTGKFEEVKWNPTYGGGSNRPGIRGTGGNGTFTLDTGVNTKVNAAGSEVGRTYGFFTGYNDASPGTLWGTATITSNTTTVLSCTCNMTGAGVVRALPSGGFKIFIDNVYISVSN